MLAPETTDAGVRLNAAASPPAGTLMVWGDDVFHQVSDAPAGSIKTVAGGSYNGLALRQDGTPALWGTHPDIGPRPIPAELLGQKYRAVALGRDDAVMIRQNGTLVGFGQTMPLDLLPAGSYTAATVAAAFGVALADDGSLTAWEWPRPGVTPPGVTPPAGAFKQVYARVNYALALREDGTLFGWGQSPVLAGWPTTPEDPAIRSLPGQTYKAIGAGNIHALGILPNGTLTGWGSDQFGGLQIPTSVRFKAVDAGFGFSIGLATDGTLWGWGNARESTIGAPRWTFESQGWTRDGDSPHYYVPGVRFSEIAAAAFHVMAITAGR